MGALTIFFKLLFEGVILIGPSSIFLENWALPNKKKHPFGPQLQNRNKCALL
jgi:hypothetical protein